MPASPRTYALAALIVTVLALGVSACATGDDEPRGRAQPPRVATTTTAETTEPAPVPEVAVRVVDGDSGKPVRGARVAVAGEIAASGGDGLVRFAEPPRRSVKLRVSARRYETETLRVRLRGRKAPRVPIWRPALQWPMYGVTPARTQAQTAIRLRPPFRRVWKRSLRSLIEFPAVVWKGVAYVNNSEGWLHAIAMEDGRVLWRKRVGTLMASSPGLDPKRGLVVTTSMSPGYVNVLSMRTGRVRWRFYTGRSEPSPVIRNGVAYFGAANGNVYALDLDRRRTRWVYRGGVKITSSPALVRNRLYFGDYAGRVLALKARTGRVVWTGSAGGRVYGTVAVARGRVFAPSVFSGLSALSARTGRLLWRIPSSTYVYSSPAYFRNRVYFGTYAGMVMSASARSGRILWSRPAGGSVSAAVQIVSGVVYAGTFRRRITAWHWRSGRELWTFRAGRYVPVSGNGSRLLVHGSMNIWAMEPKRRP
jgi:outer membrane protein assembly factor BamB